MSSRFLLVVSVCLVVVSPAAAGPPESAHGSPRCDGHGDPLPALARARLGTIRFRHGDHLSSVIFAPDGHTVASIGRDRTIRLWETSTGRPIRQFQETDVDFHAHAFSFDGRILAAAGGHVVSGSDHVIRLWEAASGKELRRLRGHRHSVYGLAFAPDGETLFSVSSEQTILWQTATGKELGQWQQLRPIGPLAFSPNRTHLFMLGKETDDRSIHVLETVSGRTLLNLTGHQQSVTCLACSPDGSCLASGNPFEPIRLWDLATGGYRSLAEQTPAVCLAFSPDGQVVASAGMDGTVHLWDTAQGLEIRRLEGYQGWASSLAFSPDGRTLALAGGDAGIVYLWDVATGKRLFSAGGHRGKVHAVAWSPDGRWIATGGDRADEDGTIFLWDPASAQPRHVLRGVRGMVLSLAFSDDGLLASSHDADGLVRLWNPADGTLRRTLGKTGTQAEGNRLSSLAFSPDGKLLAAGGTDRRIRLWNVFGGWESQVLSGHDGPITCLAFSPDGQTLVSGSIDRTVRLWGLAGGRESRHLSDFEDTVKAVAFAPDGKTLAIGIGDWQGNISFWDVAQRKELRRCVGDQGRLFHIAFSVDGRTLAAGYGDHTLRLWETATGRERRRFPGHASAIHAVAFAPDGQSLASGSADTTVLIWDLTAPDVPAGRRGMSLATLTELWQDLAGEDARRADRAIRRMVGCPSRSVAFLESKLQAPPAITPERLGQLLRDLDHERFVMRTLASAELMRLLSRVDSELRIAAEQHPSLEVRRRLQLMLKKADNIKVSPEHLQTVRALEVLEGIGSAAVRRLLQQRAREVPTLWLGQEARLIAERLAHRP